MQITAQRLTNQYLTRHTFTAPEEVVKWLGAVQAQDYPAAKWALGVRLQQATDASVEAALNDGRIIRTHVLRPTWHFVLPENLLWMQKLTADRVKQFMGSYNRKLELDETVFAKTNKLFINALQKHTYLTRQELKKILSDNDIETDVQRLAHLVMWPELDGIICSGPRRGKQFTYALVDERITSHRKLTKEESLAELALTYFQSHGPAQLRDFAWWSGLTKAEAGEGIELIKNKLEQEKTEERTFWFVPTKENIAKITTPKVFLLSIFDEYTIAYNDRSDLSEQRDIERMIAMGNALNAVIIVNGKVAGTWKRILKKNGVDIKASLFRPFSSVENTALVKAAEEYGAFVELQPHLEVL